KLACRTRNVHRLGFAFLLSVHGWKLCPFARNGLLGLTKAGVHSLGYSLSVSREIQEVGNKAGNKEHMVYCVLQYTML
ncbi:MAG: hypothetical protein IJH25_08565, partial [Clostridia bacterium]|nr:hypothetical protein [Clostridia bacterium]